MQKELNKVRFNLTPNMYLELIRFNTLKKQLINYKKSYELSSDEKLLIKILEIEKKLINSRKKFIKEFRMNNKEQIEEYLKLKDQF